jgi:capsular polysaccharide biosynthesis protein
MMPRIGILNRERRSKRSILNVEELAAYLQDELRAPVRVATFERSSFLEQVAFFSDTDIVISPHGAQLTGLPFMPQRCAAVLELFPAKYYNNYFWSLAVSAGIAHAGLYMSEQDLDKEMEHRYDGMSKQHRYKARGRWRSVHFCPNPRKMTDLIRPLIEEWKHCCRRRQQEE